MHQWKYVIDYAYQYYLRNWEIIDLKKSSIVLKNYLSIHNISSIATLYHFILSHMRTPQCEIHWWDHLESNELKRIHSKIYWHNLIYLFHDISLQKFKK